MNHPNGYAERVQRVVDYLAEHLDETLDLEVLARVACFSPYHFHRIYRALLGETVSDTLRRLRLHARPLTCSPVSGSFLVGESKFVRAMP
jgi:transcriptional regulator GlxA family with amidase domain